MSTHFFGDTALLLGRSMRHITRSVDTIITTAITPIAMMLLFVYVFGGAIQDRHRQLRQLPAARNHADRDRVGHRVHRRSVVHRHEERHFRAIPVHADRTFVRAVGTCPDLAGSQRALARDHRAGCPRHGIPHLGGPAGLARRRRNPGAVHPGTHLDRQSSPAYQRSPWTVPADSPTR